MKFEDLQFEPRFDEAQFNEAIKHLPAIVTGIKVDPSDFGERAIYRIGDGGVVVDRGELDQALDTFNVIVCLGSHTALDHRHRIEKGLSRAQLDQLLAEFDMAIVKATGGEA